MTEATAEERWELLERIAAYAAGELFGEEPRKARRLVLMNAERSGRRSLRSPEPAKDYRTHKEREPEMQRWKTKEMRQPKGQEPEKPLGSVWISCPYEEKLARSVEEALEAKARVYSGQEPPKGETPSAVLLCTKGEGVVSEMKRIRALVPDASVLVFCQAAEPRLAEKALRAGASGFVHAGMPPERIALALTLACEGEVLIPKALLGELLGQRLFLQRPWLLDP